MFSTSAWLPSSDDDYKFLHSDIPTVGIFINWIKDGGEETIVIKLSTQNMNKTKYPTTLSKCSSIKNIEIIHNRWNL